MATGQCIFPLKGVVQHYSWGGDSFIPRLTGTTGATGQPFAEYWMGAHPNFPSELETPEGVKPLTAFIDAAPQAVLGPAVAETFSGLPFLFKVLDVRQMLSIQVHPSKDSAREGFAAEEKAGIPVKAPHRNYKDENHKPELMVALSEFWLLHGFKPAAHLKEALAAVPGFEFLIPQFEQGGYEGLYRYVMDLPQEEVNRILQPVADRILPLYRNGELMKKSEDFWAARAVETFCTKGDLDRGIFSIYFFNLLCLHEGEGIFQPEGLPHAYLEGRNMELMANSDNVLRAGLTDKHIDVPELMKHTRFAPTEPVILKPAEGPVTRYAGTATEFELYKYTLDGESQPVTARSAEILFLLEGKATLQSGGWTLELLPGGAAFITAGSTYTIAPGGPAVLFRAAVPG
ncbi:MAG TPA: mannose-6-phosphate isomerase, class I [Chitinophagaceae bacterium]|jgi:mannose-6-phosphate isomerase|nr:mannose-6-phosphate isomerase, class I [Chitinophagaceae bacterium]